MHCKENHTGEPFVGASRLARSGQSLSSGALRALNCKCCSPDFTCQDAGSYNIDIDRNHRITSIKSARFRMLR